VATFFAGGNGGGGDAQRVQVYSLSAWVVLEAVDVLRGGDGPAQERRTSARSKETGRSSWS
jgi:hypothetical protein